MVQFQAESKVWRKKNDSMVKRDTFAMECVHESNFMATLHSGIICKRIEIYHFDYLIEICRRHK